MSKMRHPTRIIDILIDPRDEVRTLSPFHLEERIPPVSDENGFSGVLEPDFPVCLNSSQVISDSAVPQLLIWSIPGKALDGKLLAV
ncbi:hypothetical protein [Pseudonocardia parietis]|uniref:Uncharacterized protein n=1 Tax=Pseudonocardia parietis TaxID=570936 RepID=A0ABS4VWZ8_9PSEU|nr:hypothetical protein [Pseudonocardia parietis]MBP2368434.1 hypothetical protein [Pseudonocardia parietis]